MGGREIKEARLVQLAQIAVQVFTKKSAMGIDAADHNNDIDQVTGYRVVSDVLIQNGINDIDPGIEGDIGGVLEGKRVGDADNERAQAAVGRRADIDIFPIIAG